LFGLELAFGRCTDERSDVELVVYSRGGDRSQQDYKPAWDGWEETK